MAISLLSMYVLLTVGVHVHMHYCCGQLTRVCVAANYDPCCRTAAHKESNTVAKNCCSDNLLDLIIKDEHCISYFKYVSGEAVVNEESVVPLLTVLSKSPAIAVHPTAQKQKLRLFLQHSSLIYYA